MIPANLHAANQSEMEEERELTLSSVLKEKRNGPRRSDADEDIDNSGYKI